MSTKEKAAPGRSGSQQRSLSRNVTELNTTRADAGSADAHNLHVELPRFADIKAQIDPVRFYEVEGIPFAGKVGSSGYSKNQHCPFHDEQEGSFGFHPVTGAFRCFGCDASGGDVVDFAKLKHGLDDNEVRHWFADHWGVHPGATGRPVVSCKPSRAKGRGKDKVDDPPWAYIPESALEIRPDKPSSSLPAPSGTWKYRDEKGLICLVSRFDAGAGKEFRPQIWTESHGWRWKAPEAPRPLYGLERLQADPDVPVLVAEGEKATDAAGKLYPDRIAVTWMGGSSSVRHADWSPLADRDVLIWPDFDAPGAKAVKAIVEELRKAGARKVAVLDLSSLAFNPRIGGEFIDLPPGWDAADALADGWTAELIQRHASPEIGAGFEIRSGGPEPEPEPETPPRKADVISLVPPSPTGVGTVCASDFELRSVGWLWDGWIAKGKTHLLAGAPGTGKSSLAMALAATISRGGLWPDGTRAEQGSVVIWSGEDDPSDTLIPRLKACGADLWNVHFVMTMVDDDGPRAFDPATDVAALIDHMARMEPAPSLLILDPVVSAIAGDSHKNAEVRRSLQPLVNLAQTRNCAVLGISHFSKGTAGRDPVERITGSLAFGALVRIGLVTVKVSDSEGGGRILARAKSNLGPDDGGVGYDMDVVEVESGIDAVRVLWGERMEGSARELLSRGEGVADPEEPNALEDAKCFLREELARGPVESRVIFRRAKEAGHSEKTLRRAKNDLRIMVKRDGRLNNGKGGWLWVLSGQSS